MIVRQLFDQVSSTYSYLLACTRTHLAVLIDPVFERHTRDAALIRELGLTLRLTIDTHCHADHVTGAWLMKQAFGSKIAMSGAYGASNVDVPLTAGDTIHFGHKVLEIRATPGHTSGCLSFVTADHGTVFTGDALLVRGAGRTDFQGGDAHQLYRSINEQLFTLPDACIVYPAHDYDGRTASSIGEERLYNPRIGGAAPEEDFVGYMTNLGLPHPKQLAIAVPANLRAGEPADGKGLPTADWGPVVTTYAGVDTIAPEWLATHRADVHVVDVRGADEFHGELGHVEGAQLIPIDELRTRVAEIPTDKPVIVVCQTGKRSALGSAVLSKAGLPRTANLAGGMVRWRELGLPITE